MRTLLNDLRFAARLFGKSPWTTAAAILSLALAIGPNAALFSVVDRLLLNPASIQGMERIYRIFARTETGSEALSYPDYLDYRAGTRELADIIATSRSGVMLTMDDRKELMGMSFVSGNYFSVLGLKPAAGRVLQESDSHFEGPPPVMVSYSLWQRKFGGAADIAGKTIVLNNRAFAIVGVAPRHFRGIGLELMSMDIWMPIEAAEFCKPGQGKDFANRALHGSVTINVRLKEGVSRPAAEAAFSAIAARLAREYPGIDKGTAASLEQEAKGKNVVGLMALSLVSLVLFVACANLAGVFLAQGEARRREFAVRLALGAGRGRLVRQLLAESLLLSLAGAGAGLLFSLWLVEALPAAMPVLPFAMNFGVEAAIDGRVLAYTLLLSLATAMAAGLAPALRASRPDLTPALKGDAAGGRSRLRFRGVLLVTQVAVCQFLLGGAALLTRSYFEVQTIRTGFDPTRRLVFATVAPGDAASRLDFGSLAEKMAAVPGVRRVSQAKGIPLSGSGDGRMLEVSAAGVTREPVRIGWNSVGPGYFGITGGQMIRGRDFRKHEARGTAIVNETMARQLWGDADSAIGKYFRAGGTDCQVAGVVETGKYGWILETPRPYFFMAAPEAAGGEGVLLIETAADPAASEPEIRKALAVEPGLMLLGLMTAREQMRLAMWGQQTAAWAFGVLATLGIFLAGVGLYGLVSHSVNRRVHEIGVRMALGARPVDVVRLVLRQSLTLVAVGAAIGLAAAFAAARVVSALLYQVSPADPVALAAGVVVVAAVTFAAAHFPARRAIHVDPITALRNE